MLGLDVPLTSLIRGGQNTRSDPIRPEKGQVRVRSG